MRKGHGDGHASQKRRRRYQKIVPRQDELYQLIDNNMSYYPCKYCTCHHGFLTMSLMEVHQCMEKNCPSLKEMWEDE